VLNKNEQIFVNAVKDLVNYLKIFVEGLISLNFRESKEAEYFFG